jgi:hypothetical protein
MERTRARPAAPGRTLVSAARALNLTPSPPSRPTILAPQPVGQGRSLTETVSHQRSRSAKPLIVQRTGRTDFRPACSQVRPRCRRAPDVPPSPCASDRCIGGRRNTLGAGERGTWYRAAGIDWHIGGRRNAFGAGAEPRASDWRIGERCERPWHGREAFLPARGYPRFCELALQARHSSGERSEEGKHFVQTRAMLHQDHSCGDRPKSQCGPTARDYLEFPAGYRSFFRTYSCRMVRSRDRI